jgi:hypothetical protein
MRAVRAADRRREIAGLPSGRGSTALQVRQAAERAERATLDAAQARADFKRSADLRRGTASEEEGRG